MDWRLVVLMARDESGSLSVFLFLGGLWLVFIGIPGFHKEHIMQSLELCQVEKFQDLQWKARGDDVLGKIFPFDFHLYRDTSSWPSGEPDEVIHVPRPTLTPGQEEYFTRSLLELAAYKECVKSDASRRYKQSQIDKQQKLKTKVDQNNVELSK